MSTLATGLVSTAGGQAGALPLTAENNIFATVAASTGCRLPSGYNGPVALRLRNNGANILLAFPPVGGRLNGGSVNASLNIAINSSVWWVNDPNSPLDWWGIGTA